MLNDIRVKRKVPLKKIFTKEEEVGETTTEKIELSEIEIVASEPTVASVPKKKVVKKAASRKSFDISSLFPTFKKKVKAPKVGELRPENNRSKTQTQQYFSSLSIRISQIGGARFTIKQQTFFAKRLSFLIKAGVPILESLHMIKDQTKTRHKKIMENVCDDVANGQPLARSLAKYPKIFSDFAINIIKIGESSGILSENLEYLAEELKKKQTLKRKVTGALIYPFIITIATLGITGFLIVYIFPKIMPIFTSLHITLPITTRAVVYVSMLLRADGLLIFGVIILLVIIWTVLLKKIPPVRFVFDKYIMKVPALGKMIQSYNLANVTRTLGLLLRSGITLSEALPITAETTANRVYRREFEKLVHSVNRGEKISVSLLDRKELFPEVLVSMIAIGERSGNLSNTLIYLSEMYEAEVEDFTKNLSSLIEPVLMVFMGLLVGFIAISIITPIYGITQHLTPR